MFAGKGKLVGGVGSSAQFAMDLVVVGVEEEGVEQGVCRFDGMDGVGSQEWRETFLPVVVAAFDFALGLRCRGVAQGDAVEMQGLTELGEGVGRVGKEERVVIDVERERQSMGEEGAGEEIEVGGE